jgi:hypothetical protein
MAKSVLISVAAIALSIAASTALSQINQSSHLNSTGQSKVNKALAKGWAANDGSSSMENRSVVNIGKKGEGNCTVNVGTTQKGQKAPKEVVVTAKEIINVCK